MPVIGQLISFLVNLELYCNQEMYYAGPMWYRYKNHYAYHIALYISCA